MKVVTRLALVVALAFFLLAVATQPVAPQVSAQTTGPGGTVGVRQHAPDVYFVTVNLTGLPPSQVLWFFAHDFCEGVSTEQECQEVMEVTVNDWNVAIRLETDEHGRVSFAFPQESYGRYGYAVATGRGKRIWETIFSYGPDGTGGF